MTKFKVPELPSDGDVKIKRTQYMQTGRGSDIAVVDIMDNPIPVVFTDGVRWMRDHYAAKHREAAVIAIEALNWISADKLDLEIVKISDRDVLREVIKMIHLTAKEALADAQKIYEQTEK